MSDRLQFFREQMAAFEGSSDPQKAIEKGYFIKQPRSSLASTIANRIALRPSSSHLLIGGIGSGKTTQLMMARDLINEIEDIHAIYVDASLYTDISEIQPGALIAIVGLVLSDLANNIEDQSIQELSDFINRKAYGHSETIKKESTLDVVYKAIELRHKIQKPQYETIKHKGVLNKTSKNQKSQEVIKNLYKVNKNQHGKSIIVIIDALDRLNNLQLFLEVVSNDIEVITKAGVGIILVGSLAVTYSEHRSTIKQLFSYDYYQPCFDIYKDEESFKFFAQILKTRSIKEDFIEKSASDSIIEYSGGVLRDLINLTQASIEEAYVSGDDKINPFHVQNAVNSFGQGKILGITNDELEVLKRILQKKEFTPRTQEDIQLLASQRILEYQYPEKRYVVHPTIKNLLQKTSDKNEDI